MYIYYILVIHYILIIYIIITGLTGKTRPPKKWKSE